MKENVGKIDRIARSIIGPALLVVGYKKLGGDRGELVGLAAMIAGTTLVESAITRVCPLNTLFGIDTRRKEEVVQDFNLDQEKVLERMPNY